MGFWGFGVMGPLLFNIFINDLFEFVEEALCNFADDNSLSAFAKNLLQVLHSLELETRNLLEWFRVNSIAANPGKFQLMLLGNTGNIDHIKLNIGNVTLEPKNCVKLLGVKIDCKLNFSEHVKTLCKSASNKVKALFRIRPYLNISSTKKLSEAYILSTFNYCPLIWMYGYKGNDTLINKVHTRALRAVYLDFTSSFETLLENDASVSIHVQNLRFLLRAVYNIIWRGSPSFLWVMFTLTKSPYVLRSGNRRIILPNAGKTQTYGLNSLVFRGSLLWNCLPSEIKSADSPKLFKTPELVW